MIGLQVFNDITFGILVFGDTILGKLFFFTLFTLFGLTSFWWYDTWYTSFWWYYICFSSFWFAVFWYTSFSKVKILKFKSIHDVPNVGTNVYSSGVRWNQYTPLTLFSVRTYAISWILTYYKQTTNVQNLTLINLLIIILFQLIISI